MENEPSAQDIRLTALHLAVELVNKSGSSQFEADQALITAAKFEGYLVNGTSPQD